MKVRMLVFVQFFTLLLSLETIDGLNNDTEISTAHKLTSRSLNSSLICVQAVWRHGHRTQLYTFPTDESFLSVTKLDGNTEEDLGKLTLKGVISSHRLGEYLRSRYDNFLAKNFSLSEFSVVSSATHRTVMTGLSVAQGLFPTRIPTSNGHDTFWYPVPVMIVPSQVDNYILQDRECQRNSALFSKYKSSSKINTKEAVDLYKYLTFHSGMIIKNYEDVYRLQDTIFDVQNKGFRIPVPDWAASVQQQIFNLAKLEFIGFVDSFEMMRFVAGPLLYNIVYNFNCTLGIPPMKKDDDCKYVKAYGISGHDTTISPLLYLFGHYNIDSPPPYNALLLFELHQNGNEHFIRIYYRPDNTKKEDSSKELLLKPCGDGPCEFQRFQEIYKDFIIDEKTWQKYCNDVTVSADDRSIWNS